MVRLRATGGKQKIRNEKGDLIDVLTVDTPRPIKIGFHYNSKKQIVGYLFSGTDYRYWSCYKADYVKEPDASIVDATYKVREHRKKFTFTAGVCRRR